MSDGLDSRELDTFIKQMLTVAERTMAKESKKFMMQEGNKLRSTTKKKARQKVKKRSGNYEKGIKRGKVYKYQGEDLSIRVYHGSPHAHLIEHGHRIVGRDGSEHGFKKGLHVYEEAGREFENQFVKDCEQFIDDLLDKGLN